MGISHPSGNCKLVKQSTPAKNESFVTDTKYVRSSLLLSPAHSHICAISIVQSGVKRFRNLFCKRFEVSGGSRVSVAWKPNGPAPPWQ